MNSRTGNARTTSAIPPRWSSCRCVSRTRSIPVARRARSRPVSVAPPPRPAVDQHRLARRPRDQRRVALTDRHEVDAERRGGQGRDGRPRRRACGGAVHTASRGQRREQQQPRSKRRTNRFTPHATVTAHANTRKPISGMAAVSAAPNRRCAIGNQSRRGADNDTGQKAGMAQSFRLRALRQWRRIDVARVHRNQMGGKAFEAIAAALRDALAYARGDTSRGRLIGFTFPISTSSTFVAGSACRRWTSPPPSASASQR